MPRKGVEASSTTLITKPGSGDGAKRILDYVNESVAKAEY